MNDTLPPESPRSGSAGPFTNLGQAAADEPPPQASDVGTLLCATRMRVGKDLQDVAAVLHIRYNFLVAIEDGRYEDLPGQAYAIGFVRAYADHLGLDGDEVVRRYKEETAGIKRVTRYEYPIPAPESGLPSGALLLIAVVLGMVVYGVWYSMADADRRAADVIQEVPDRLAALLKSDQTTAPTEPAETLAAENVPGDNIASQDAATQQTATLAPEETVPPSEEDAESAAPVETAPQTVAPAQTPPPASTPVAAPAAPKPAPAASQVAQQSPAPAQPVVPARAPVAAPTPTAQPAPPVVAKSPAPVTTIATSQTPAAPTSQAAAPSTPAPSPTSPVAEKKPDTVKPPVVAAATQIPAAAPVTPPAPAAPKPVVPSSQTQPAQTQPTQTQPAQTAAVPPPAAKPATPPPTPSVPTSTAPASTQPATPPPVVRGQARNQVASAGKNNVELRAKSDSWIQVRDGEQLLLTRFLRKGEVYKVPDRAGLTLMTLNAGGIEIMVDGDVMPSLGDAGTVARGVVLDADKLKAQPKTPAKPAPPAAPAASN